mmetsp:Transcript_22604/g.33055  ORF Transcript_22604/g.33055 Transcript_22604/m.33055 type:complete len:222 (-) Transcript_22604:1425-2090(-)
MNSYNPMPIASRAVCYQTHHLETVGWPRPCRDRLRIHSPAIQSSPSGQPTEVFLAQQQICELNRLEPAIQPQTAVCMASPQQEHQLLFPYPLVTLVQHLLHQLRTLCCFQEQLKEDAQETLLQLLPPPCLPQILSPAVQPRPKTADLDPLLPQSVEVLYLQGESRLPIESPRTVQFPHPARPYEQQVQRYRPFRAVAFLLPLASEPLRYLLAPPELTHFGV